MCLTVPRRVEKVEGERALMQDGRWVNVGMVGDVKVGDHLMVQADMAVEKVSKERVREMRIMIQDS